VKRFILSALISIFLAGCKGKLYRAASASMETTIKTGETFYVSRTNSFKRNDIAVFDYYGNDYSSPPDENMHFKMHWEKRIYRLIALSGDSLQIKNAEVFVNKKHISEEPTLLNEYSISAKAYIDDLPERNSEYGLGSVKERFGDTIKYRVLLTRQEVDKYELRKQVVISIKKFISPAGGLNDDKLARPAANLLWTVDNYGPLYIPKTGDTINVSEENYLLYGNIPGIQMGKNVIKENLYFAMGDNRHRADDSRYIGLITHSKMVGIVK
jgi:signal peptidase I